MWPYHFVEAQTIASELKKLGGSHMKSDADIKKDVEAELRWTPYVDDTDVAIKVKGGEVTLTGFVSDVDQKYQAEVAVKRIAGVSAVANDIQVTPASGGPSDPEIARAAQYALKNALPFTHEAIKAVVQEGTVTLEGKVEWDFQRTIAESAVRPLRGVVALFNLITLAPKVAPADIKQKIESAFQRIAQLDAGHISVDTQGSQVTLRGEVSSWAERDQAQQTAWFAPGVTQVKNELRVRL
jgi:osmotically-inducible protein OsmY